MAEAFQVVDMVDAIGVNARAIPAGTKKVAIYLTGSGGIAWTNADVDLLLKDDPEIQVILRIDQSNSVLAIPVYLVKDIEPGAATLPVAIQEASRRKAVGLRTCFYFFKAEEAGVRQAVLSTGLDGWIDYWLADWNLDRNQAIALLEQDYVAVQWASPSSNPELRYIDLSVTRSTWPSSPPVKPPPPKPKRSQALLTATEDGTGASWEIHGVDNPGDAPLQNSATWHSDVSYRNGKWGVVPLAAKLGALQIHPKVIAAGTIGTVLTAVAEILTLNGVHIPAGEVAAVTTLLSTIAGYLTPSGGKV